MVFVLTLIFTVNTCIVLFLQLQSHARSARRLKFLLVPRLSLSLFRRLERPYSLGFLFSSFFYISFYRVFFVGTRGYVRQRRVITLNNAARRVATGFCPNGRGLRCNRKAENAGDASIDKHLVSAGFSLAESIEETKKRENYGDFGIGSAFDRLPCFTFISLY